MFRAVRLPLSRVIWGVEGLSRGTAALSSLRFGTVAGKATEERGKHMDRISRMMEKPDITKKMHRKLQSELHFLGLTDRIERGKERASLAQKASSPSKKQVEGDRLVAQFQPPPFDVEVLQYIKKHQLHRTKNLPEVRQQVNSFVDEVRMG